MSESRYLKCLCQNCSAPIEFPVHGIGSSVACPHCHQRTTLFAPPIPATAEAGHEAFPSPSEVPDLHEPIPDAATNPRKALGRLVAIALTVTLTGAAAAFIVFRGNVTAPNVDNATGNLVGRDDSSSLGSGSGSAESGQPFASPNAPKAPEDLKVGGGITLEKAKGTGLVYAIGVLRNNSDHQRFDVHIELELSDAKGNRAGVAKDYRSVIEPRQEWRFRALVLDPKAVTAKLSSIREQE